MSSDNLTLPRDSPNAIRSVITSWSSIFSLSLNFRVRKVCTLEGRGGGGGILCRDVFKNINITIRVKSEAVIFVNLLRALWRERAGLGKEKLFEDVKIIITIWMTPSAGIEVRVLFICITNTLDPEQKT